MAHRVNTASTAARPADRVRPPLTEADLDAQSPAADLVRVYLNGIGRTALLTAEDEVDLAKRIEAGLFATEKMREIAEKGDKLPVAQRRDLTWICRDGNRAKNHLLEANLRLVVSLAKRYTGRGMLFLDLIQEGNLGLIRAVEIEDLPAEPLLRADTDDDDIARAACTLARADAVIHAELDETSISVPLTRLMEGALSGNLGPIDSPAFRFHMLPQPHQWQWAGTLDLGAAEPGETVYARLCQRDGQMAWTSPIFFGDAAQ